MEGGKKRRKIPKFLRERVHRDWFKRLFLKG